jgi:hypothetical protein
MGTTRERVKNAIDEMASRAHHATDALAEAARNGTDKVADAADAIDTKAHDAAGAVGHARDAVKSWATDVANHPGQHIKAGGTELTHIIQRHPVPAILVGIGVGFMLARMIRTA